MGLAVWLPGPQLQGLSPEPRRGVILGRVPLLLQAKRIFGNRGKERFSPEAGGGGGLVSRCDVPSLLPFCPPSCVPSSQPREGGPGSPCPGPGGLPGVPAGRARLPPFPPLSPEQALPSAWCACPALQLQPSAWSQGAASLQLAPRPQLGSPPPEGPCHPTSAPCPGTGRAHTWTSPPCLTLRLSFPSPGGGPSSAEKQGWCGLWPSGWGWGWRLRRRGAQSWLTWRGSGQCAGGAWQGLGPAGLASCPHRWKGP